MVEHKRQSAPGSSSEAVTNNVRVEVESQYAPDRSQPFESRWFFHYTVRVTNERDETVQLLSRHWIITDGNQHVEEVRGPGVVGETPSLEPGQSFNYTSGCMLRTQFGTMAGTYQMVRPDGTTFDAVISPFVLALPHAIN